jgi:flagellar hook-associated protein 1 FlgK
MPGLFGNLTSAAKALQAHQVAIEVTGRNIANVNNPEYARQRVLMGDRFSVATSNGPEGSGVEVLEVQQLRDALLDRQVIHQISDKEGLLAQQTALSNAELALGDRVDAASTPTSVTDASSSALGIGGALDDLFNSFDTLSASPTEVPVREAAIQSAQILADRINTADSRLSSLQSDLELQLKSDVDKANALLVDIARLNAEIRQADSRQSGGAADLVDRRQSKLEALAGLGNFVLSAPFDARNQVDVSLGGQLLVTYGLTPKGPNPLSYQNATPLVNGTFPLTSATGFVQGAFMLSGINVTSSLTSGAMAGRYSAMTGGISTLRNQLKTFSDQISTAVNSKYSPNGTSGPGAFFAGTPTSGLLQVSATLTSANLATGPLSDPTNPALTPATSNAGDNTFIKNIAALRRAIFSTAGIIAPGTPDKLTGKLGDYIRSVVSSLGQTLKSVNTRAEESTVIDTAIRAQRDAVSGVSLDEETTNLMRYQRAYQANAKVISVIDTMLESLINSMVR